MLYRRNDKRFSRRSEDGKVWCRGCKDWHAPEEFSPQHLGFAQSCRSYRNRSLQEKRNQKRNQRSRELSCAQCGKIFTAYTSLRKFCSRPCKTKACDSKRWGKWDKKSRLCFICNAEYIPKNPSQKTCSKRCKWRRSDIVGKGKQQRTLPLSKPDIFCENCGAKVSQKHNRPKKLLKFCSLKCHYATNRGSRHDNWRGGSNKYPSYWKDISEKARSRDGNLCQCCPNGTVGKRLPVDHIIPLKLLIKWGISDNDEELLLTTCRICHGRKVGPEKKLFKGDIMGFVAGLNLIGYPMTRVRIAMEKCGLRFPDAYGSAKIERLPYTSKAFAAPTELPDAHTIEEDVTPGIIVT